MIAEECDYVVVGAGSAGCVVAARLSENGKHDVVLLEAGDEDRGFWIHAPLGFGKLYNEPSLNWSYDSEPEPGLGGQRSYQPRGKVFGGTGSINGMVYMRGGRQDYDRWRDLGNPGWGYEDVLPYFKKSEANFRGDGTHHGVNGPVTVVDGPMHELGTAFIRAAQECGFEATADHCGQTHEGFGVPQMTIRRGRRSSTATAYLRPARRRANLHVLGRAHVTRINIENRTAVGVEYYRNGASFSVKARREVVLCAGVFNTPQLLQLSGLGPGKTLKDAGIPVIENVPGIGDDLEDHFGVNLAFRCRRAVTITDAVSNPLKRAAMGLRYVALRSGPIATHGTYCTGFFRSNPQAGSADSHISLVGWARSGPGKATNSFGLLDFPAYSLTASIVSPHSRGSVCVTSPDSTAAPSIRFNFFQDPRDQDLLLRIVRTARQIASAPAMQAYTESEVLPGLQTLTNAQLLEFCRHHGRSTHHAAGSCKMSPQGPVDTRLRLRSVSRLRVIDASVMPAMIAGNINATVVMIAEKGVAMMLQDAS